MLLNMVMFKVTICDIGKMNINMTDKIEKRRQPLQYRTMAMTTTIMSMVRASAAMTAAWNLRRHELCRELQRITSKRATHTRRCSSTTTQTIWVAVVTSPTLTARWCSILSMCLSVKSLLRNATTFGITPYLFNAKEFDEETGMYYYGARYYDPRVSLWISTDPKQESYFAFSSYVYCGNNPLIYIDPNGKEWEDPAQAEKLKAKIDNKITSIQKSILAQKARLESNQAKGKDISKQERKIADFESRISNLNQSKSDIDLLGHDSQKYKLTQVSGEGAHMVRLENNGTISIETSEDALSIHEITHVRQALDAGGLEFSDSGCLKNPGTRAKGLQRYIAISEAEIEAYKMQYSYRPESLPISVDNISIINVHYVGSIKDPNGGYGYPMIKDYSDFLKSQQKFKNK